VDAPGCGRSSLRSWRQAIWETDGWLGDAAAPEEDVRHGDHVHALAVGDRLEYGDLACEAQGGNQSQRRNDLISSLVAMVKGNAAREGRRGRRASGWHGSHSGRADRS
jgi:hypothetical protein